MALLLLAIAPRLFLLLEGLLGHPGLFLELFCGLLLGFEALELEPLRLRSNGRLPLSLLPLDPSLLSKDLLSSLIGTHLALRTHELLDGI